MFKNMKLRTRIGGGFFILIIFIILIAVLNWYSIYNMSEMNSKSEEINQIVTLMKEARRQEKNFIIRKDISYKTEVDNIIKQVRTHIDNIDKKIDTKDLKTMLNNINTSINDYEKSFTLYVNAEQNKSEIEEKLLAYARELENLSVEIKNDQQEQLEELYIRKANDSEIKDRFNKIEFANQIVILSLESRRAEKNYIMRKNKEYIDEVKSYVDRLKQLAKELKNILFRVENKERTDNIIKNADYYYNAFSEFCLLIDQQENIDKEMVEEARIVDKESLNMKDIIKKDVEKDSATTITITTIISLLSITLGFLISIFTTASITKPINKLVKASDFLAKGKLDFERFTLNSKNEMGKLASSFNSMLDFFIERNTLMERLAKGDLTVNVELASDEDEVGKALSNMVASLREIVSQIESAAEQMLIGSNQISESTQSLSAGSAEQASSLEEITATITEIATQAQQNVDNALKADEIGRETKEIAEKGNLRIKDLVVAMEKINKSSNDIKNIVKIIDDMAFQTNLLALNADIEAARVGKYGRGFAVVAGSVRTLAGKSGSAVKETTIMVDEAIKNIEKVSILVEQTEKQLENITNSAIRLRNIIKEVSQASQEQAAGIEQINTGLSQIEDVVQSNSANAEENAAASEELSAQAKRLKDTISYFKVKSKETLSITKY